MKRLQLGLIGGGRMGAVHGSVFAELAKAGDTIDFIAVADTAQGIAAKLAKQLGVDQAYENIDEILEDSKIEAVFVATPTFTHYKIVKKVLMKGKHCLCEKPLTLDLEESRELTQLAADLNLVLQIGFMRRFDPDVISAKESVDRGEIGTPLIYKACKVRRRRDFAIPAKAEGLLLTIIFMNLMPGDLSLMMRLWRFLPNRVLL